MTRMWGIHNDHPDLDLVANGFVSVGWDDLGDLTAIGPDRETLKRRLIQTYPTAKPGAIPVWAGLLLRFAYEIEVGDIIVYPYKPDSTLNFGRVSGDYYFDAAAPIHRNRRHVTWLRTGIPRAEFSKGARYEVGSAVTLFSVKTHAAEFQAFLDGASLPPIPPKDPSDVSTEEATASAEDEPNAERIAEYTRDFVIETLVKGIGGIHFEHLTAALLKAMGYRAQVTPPSGDGGFDVIAHRDPLGLEPPIIKVQCKRTLSSIGAPDVQKLLGTLAPGGQELGLFVTLGAFSKDAQHLSRTRQDLRLINGRELVDLIFDYYDHLGPEWKRILPMRSVYVVDREPEAT